MKLIAVAAVLAASIAPARNARAMDVGGQFGFGAGLAEGTTHRELDVDGRTRDPRGGGVAMDFAARFWAGAVLVGGSAMVLPGLNGPTEVMATGGAGLKLELGQRWRLMSLLEAGSHTLAGVGGTLLDDTEGGTVTLPCWGARLAFVKQRVHSEAGTLGVTLFYLADRRTKDVSPRVKGFLSSDWQQERHRAGGALGGVALHATFGS